MKSFENTLESKEQQQQYTTETQKKAEEQKKSGIETKDGKGAAKPMRMKETKKRRANEWEKAKTKTRI